MLGLGFITLNGRSGRKIKHCDGIIVLLDKLKCNKLVDLVRNYDA
jgi:hypothetical protein